MGLKDLLKGIFSKAIDDLPEDQLKIDPPRTFTEAEVKERERLAAEKAGKDFSEKEKGIKAREDAVASQEKEGKKKAISDFCEGLLKAGKLTPAMTKQGMGLVPFLDAVAGIPAEVEFEEGGQKKKQTALDFAKSFLEALPKAIEFREIARRDGEIPTDFEKLVEAHQTEKKCSKAEAISFVARNNPEAHAEYLESLEPKKKE